MDEVDASAAPSPSDNTTMTAVLAGYRKDGFAADFEIAEQAVLCCSCAEDVTPAEIVVHSLRRLEGASDPADMAAVMAVTCPRCQAKGVVIARYGPEASETEAELLLSARDRRFESSDVPAAAPNERG